MPNNMYQPVIWVDNETEARNTYIIPGSTAFFMDKNVQKFYIKSTTLSGDTASFRMFEFTEVVPPQPEPEQNAFVTSSDFTKAIEDLKAYIDNAVKPKRRNSNAQSDI